uniref:Putative salivary kunitz domain protein n=1 Tax=Ixodes ricinus TaxID=34613 RepID=A0A6B0UQ93_IXORI
MQTTAGRMMFTTRKYVSFVVFASVAVLAATMPAQDCARATPPKCSLVFPSILFLNPCQYVCFERLLLPSISVRTHPDGTLCTSAFGVLEIGSCRNGTCVHSPSESTVRPVQPTNKPETTTPHAVEKSP